MPENDLKIDTASSGSIYFASDVIATIVGLALTEIEGIANVVRYNGLRSDKNGKKSTVNIKVLTKGIKVDVKDSEVSVDITTVIEYGYSVPEVCRSIQENVKKTVETMTGMSVKRVDVHVTGLNFDKEDEENAGADFRNFIPGKAARAILEGVDKDAKEE